MPFSSPPELAFGLAGILTFHVNGSFSQQVTESAAYEGYWVETWNVGGVAASPTFFVGSNVLLTIYGRKGGTHTTSVALGVPAGVMAVAETAKFTLERLKKRVF